MPEYKTGSDFDPDQNKNQAENTLEQPKTPDKSLTETQDPEAMMTEPMKEVFGAIKDFYHKYEHLASDEAIDELNDDFERFAEVIDRGRGLLNNDELKSSDEIPSNLQDGKNDLNNEIEDFYENLMLQEDLSQLESFLSGVHTKVSDSENRVENTFTLRVLDILRNQSALLFAAGKRLCERKVSQKPISSRAMAMRNYSLQEHETPSQFMHDFAVGSVFMRKCNCYFSDRANSVWFVNNIGRIIKDINQIVNEHKGDPGFNYTNYQEAWNDRPDLNNISPEEREAFEQKIKSVMLPWERKIAWIKQSSDYEEMRKNYEKAKAEGDIS